MTEYLRDARWIWQKDALSANAHAEFFTRFFSSSGKQYYFYVSADSNYALYINDRFIESGQYPDFHSYKVYDRINITPYVASGDNNVHIVGYCQNQPSSTYRPGKAGIIFSITEEEGGEERVIVNSDENIFAIKSVNYLSEGVELITNQLSFSFRYDSTAIPQTITPLDRAVLAEGMPTELHPRPVKKLMIQPPIPVNIIANGTFTEKKGNTVAEKMQYAALSYRPLPSARHLPNSSGVRYEFIEDDGIYTVIDTGAENVGYIYVEFETEEECDVHIGWGEHLEDLRIRTSVGGRNFAGLYRASKGKNSFLYPLKRSGLRYLSLHFYTHKIDLNYAGIRPTVYPLSKVPYFKCADDLHNKIYEVSRRTLEMCMHDHYEDCPWREQAQYTMDSRNQMLCGYYVFGEYDFPKASLRLMAHSLREDGLLELCSPASVYVTIPSFTAVYLLQLYEYLLYSGDAEFIREVLPVAKTIADGFIARTDENGLQRAFRDAKYWNFYEWSQGLSGSIRGYNDDNITYDAPLCAFCSIAYNSLSEILNILGDEEGSAYYAAARDRINEAANESFWCESENAYYSYITVSTGEKHHFGELTQALMVYCGACPEPRLTKVLRDLASCDTRFVPVTVSHSIFKYDALMTKPMLYAETVFRSVSEIWGDMLFKGATTFFETSDGADAFSYAGSLCHGWSAVPSYLYFKYLLGAAPAKDGSGTCLVTPIKAGIHEPKGKLLLKDGSEALI